MISSPLRTAVIGVGYLGKSHARIYSELASGGGEIPIVFEGIADIDQRREEVARQYKVPFYKDYHALLGKVDAVNIATPTSTHYAIARDFLAAGIHTLIEKPITLRLEEADELIRLAVDHNCVLQVGHLERHNPGLRRVAEIAKNIRFFEIHRLGPFTGRIHDCGVVLDLMIHDLDIVMNLIQSEIAYFDALGVNVLTPFEDIANVRIRFQNGAVADLTASRLTPERQRKIRIFQEDAYISLDYEAQSCKIFRKSGNAIAQEVVDITKAEPLKEEIKYFLAGIYSGEKLGKPDHGARNALAFALKIVDAIKAQNEKVGISS